MNRLTIKDKAVRDNFNAEYAKLADLEDIEEELGIELTVLFSALKNGAYYFASDGQLIHDYVWLEDDYVCTGQRSKLSLSFRTFSEVDTLLFKDYGKTWAKSINELKNEQQRESKKITKV